MVKKPRWYDEQMTDNSKIEYCKQCKNCKYWNGGDAYSNDYQKTCCAVYPYPSMKPMSVIENKGDCVYREVQ